MIATRALVAAVVACAACSADRPGSTKPDAATMSTVLEAPSIDVGTPMTTPLDTVALRGTTSGARIVVKTASGDAVEQSPLPGGGFCLDAPLAASGPTDLDVYALRDGEISPSTHVTVTKDATAPMPSTPVCLGQEMPVCVAETAASNNCSNGKDDDCNGLSDACDPGCNGCIDDALEPNNQPFFVPMVAAGTYQLQLCPCLVDWIAFAVVQNDTIHVKTTFNSTTLDLDLKLQTSAAAEADSAVSVAASVTTTGVEEITYKATASGTYYLKVYPYDPTKRGAYTLTVY